MNNFISRLTGSAASTAAAGILSVLLVVAAPTNVQADSLEELTKQMQQMQRQMLEMQKQLKAAQSEAATAKAQAEAAKAEAMKASAGVAPAPGQKLDPDAVQQAIDTLGEREKAKSIQAGTLAEAKPSAELTEDDYAAMSRKSLLVDGITPGYKAFPGTNSMFKIGGFVRADTIHDVKRVVSSLDNDAGSWAFGVLTDDDPGQGERGKTFVTTQTSRVNIDIRTKTPGYGLFDNLDIFLEGDFYSSENNFRIRHAFGEWGPLLVGKTWPMFAPLEAMPSLFDFGGPVISTPVRENEVRWDQPFGDKFRLGVNIEKPDAELTIPVVGGVAVGEANNSTPDFTLRGIYEDDWGHVKASGMYRRLEVNARAPGYSDDQATGWNAWLSGAFKLGDGRKDKLGWGLSYGEGFSRWRTALSGQGQDAVLTTSGLKTVPTYGGFLSYERHWTPKLHSSLLYSYLQADNPTGANASAINKTNYGLANLIWSVTPVVNLGFETVYVDRKNEDGAFGDRLRLNFVSVWKFHKDTPKTSAYRDLSYLFGGG
jgi:hypothetical protein